MNLDSQSYIKEYINSRDVAETTKDNYRRILNVWVNWLIINGIPWNQVRKPHIVNFKHNKNDHGMTSSSVNTYLSVIIDFYRNLFKDGLYDDIIGTGIKLFPKYNGFRKMPLNLDQIVKLIDSIDRDAVTGERDHLIINIMLLSGLRGIEVSRLNIEDFRMKNSDKPYFTVLGKGCKEKKRVPISPITAEAVEIYLDTRISKKDEPIFTSLSKSCKGERISASRIGKMIKTRMTKAGITDPQISAHSLRHTHAVFMIKEGMSVYDVQTSLRHTSVEMTSNYLRYLEEENRMDSSWIRKFEGRINDYRYDNRKSG